ncbi:MAG TPA: DPP IV N-terminal domain-containing protein [Flavobacteriales bacterium]|nr:DPP IV N-terminal domain-containing protein [Flavobacteriales bacterium]
MKNILMALAACLCSAFFIKPPGPEIILKEPGVENAYPRLSGNGKKILYQSNRTGQWQLYILEVASGKSTRITNDTFDNNFPDWSPKNDWIAFVSNRDGNEEIYTMKTDGSGLKRLTGNAARDIHPYFSPDGKYLLFNSTRGNGSLDIYRLKLEGLKTEQLTDTYDDETCARYSPDMKKIVYLRNNAREDDVYVLDMNTALSDNLTKTPKLTDGWPMFSNDGKWIYYSGMETGVYCINRIGIDGKNKQQLTRAKPGEEDARVFVAADGRSIIYNKRVEGLIAIYGLDVSKL